MSTLLKISSPIQERIVQIPGGEGFAVRGLNPLNIFALYKRHMGQLEPMFEVVMSAVMAKGAVDGEELQSLLLGLLTQSPVLTAELIVIASGGDPSNTEDVTIIDPISREPVTLPTFDAALAIAMALPFTVQVDALSKLGELTFTQDMPPGKFLALTLALIQRMSGAIYQVVSANGSGESDGASTS